MSKLITKISNIFNITIVVLIGVNFFLKSSIISYITTFSIPFQIGFLIYLLTNTIKEHIQYKRQSKLISFIMKYNFEKGDTIYINPSILKSAHYCFPVECGVIVVYDKSVSCYKVETLRDKRKKRINSLV